jgi:nucleoside diphosphate kinase
MVRLSESDVQHIYAEHVGRPYFPQIVRHMISDTVIGFEVAGPNALNAMKVLAGPTNP